MNVSIIATWTVCGLLVVSIWTPTFDGVGYSEPHFTTWFSSN